MTAMFDTLKFARALRDGGRFTPEQSERLSDALSEAIAGEVVSRADLGTTESKLGRKIDDLQSELAATEARLDRKIDDLEGKLDRRIDDLEGKLDRRIDDLEGKLDHLRTDLDRNVKELRAELKTEAYQLRAELKGDHSSFEAKFEAAKADTIKWVVGIIGFQSVAIIGAAIVLARILAH